MIKCLMVRLWVADVFSAMGLNGWSPQPRHPVECFRWERNSARLSGVLAPC